jgi:hypothetical protein
MRGLPFKTPPRQGEFLSACPPVRLPACRPVGLSAYIFPLVSSDNRT